MFLKDAWYVIAWADEVTAGLHACRVLDEKIVLYRTQAGEPVAFEDYCPHRRLPLSLGRLHGDRLECGYHGLTFDSDGVCVAAPTNAHRIPGGACLRRYPCEERYGLVWIWMGEASAADPADIFKIEEFGQPGWGYNRGKAIDIRCNYEYINDNLLDPSHVAWVHQSTFAEESTRDTPLEAEVSGAGVVVSRWMFDREPAPFYAPILGFDGHCDRLQHYEVRYPSHALIRAVFTPAGTGGKGTALHEQAFVMDSYNFMTPVDERNTRYYWFQLRNVQADDEDLSRRMSEGVKTAFEEDREVLEAVQAGMDERPDGAISMRSDFGGFRFRRALRERIAAQAVRR